MTDDATTMETNWHLDKRVPIALILAIIIQSSAAIWWAASMDARLKHAERALTDRAALDPRLTRLETITAAQTRSLERIEDKLDRLVESDR